MSGKRASLGEIAPSEGRGAEPEPVTVVSEGVEEGVGGAVIGLRWRTEDAGGGREEDERGQIEVLGELVEMESSVDLGSKDAIDALGSEGGEEPIVEDACGVDD